MSVSPPFTLLRAFHFSLKSGGEKGGRAHHSACLTFADDGKAPVGLRENGWMRVSNKERKIPWKQVSLPSSPTPCVLALLLLCVFLWSGQVPF